MKTRIIALMAFIVPNVCLGGWFSAPKDYDECILESMKGVTSDEAAKEIRSACRSKFPYEYHEETLDKSELSKITGNARIESGALGDVFVIELYNGTNRWLTTITVMIKSDDGKINQIYDLYGGTFFSPNSVETRQTRILKWPKGVGMSWSIVKATIYH